MPASERGRPGDADGFDCERCTMQEQHAFRHCVRTVDVHGRVVRVEPEPERADAEPWTRHWPGVLGRQDERFQTIRWEGEQVPRWSCPVHDLTHETAEWLRAWRFYERGHARPFAEWHDFDRAVYIALDGERAALERAAMWRPPRE